MPGTLLAPVISAVNRGKPLPSSNSSSRWESGLGTEAFNTTTKLGRKKGSARWGKGSGEQWAGGWSGWGSLRKGTLKIVFIYGTSMWDAHILRQMPGIKPCLHFLSSFLHPGRQQVRAQVNQQMENPFPSLSLFLSFSNK